MILIADSGSTNTDWAILKKSETFRFQSIGLNPYFLNEEQITNAILTNFPIEINPAEIQQIYFYGSGCGSDKTKPIIYNALNKLFLKSTIKIDTDLMAAAKALFLDQKGIAAILGTGSNSCLYDGQKIIENLPSLGFILSDEGGSVHMGKLLITDYLNGQLPEDLHKKLCNQFSLNKEAVLSKLYKESNPNLFLSSFGVFLHQYIQSEYIQTLIETSFSQFFEKYIYKYTNYTDYTLRITGSTGFFFKDQLMRSAQTHSIHIDEVIQKPIEKLIAYHNASN